MSRRSGVTLRPARSANAQMAAAMAAAVAMAAMARYTFPILITVDAAGRSRRVGRCGAYDPGPRRSWCGPSWRTEPSKGCLNELHLQRNRWSVERTGVGVDCGSCRTRRPLYGMRRRRPLHGMRRIIAFALLSALFV